MPTILFNYAEASAESSVRRYKQGVRPRRGHPYR